MTEMKRDCPITEYFGNSEWNWIVVIRDRYDAAGLRSVDLAVEGLKDGHYEYGSLLLLVDQADLGDMHNWMKEFSDELVVNMKSRKLAIDAEVQKL